MAIEARNLRHRVRIERPAPTQDEYGAQVNPDAWPEWKTVWARIQPLGGREFDYGKSFAATVSHKVTIRYVADLLPTYRLNFGGRIFQINGVLNVEERDRELNLYCTEMINGNV